MSAPNSLAELASQSRGELARLIEPRAWCTADAISREGCGIPREIEQPIDRSLIQADRILASGYAKRDEVLEDNGEEMQGCEHCGAEVPLEEAVSSEGCWYCQKCFAEWRAEFDACEHDWELEPHYSEHGEEGRYCKKCSGFVANEDAEALGIALKTAAPSQEKP